MIGNFNIYMPAKSVIKPSNLMATEVTEQRYLQKGLERGPYLYYYKYYLARNSHERTGAVEKEEIVE